MQRYLEQPAVLIEREGQWYVQMTVNEQAYWKSFQVKMNDAFEEVRTLSVDEKNNQKRVEYRVDSPDALVEATATIAVPLKEGQVYEAVYRFRILLGQEPVAVEEVSWEKPYVVWKEDEDSLSVADQYFKKPAKCIQKGSNTYIQLTLTNENWWQSFKVNNRGKYEDVVTVSVDEEKQERVVRFPISHPNVSTVEAKVHIIVTGIPGFHYDNEYDIRLQFDLSSTVLQEGSIGQENRLSQVKIYEQTPHTSSTLSMEL